MSSVMPPVGAEMTTNVSAAERTPRIIIALAAGVAAAWTSNPALKGVLVGAAAAMLATVATGYCPINAAGRKSDAADARWRTLRTFRVEP
jgi:hypothetical protein